jgi:hypothetical protein
MTDPPKIYAFPLQIEIEWEERGRERVGTLVHLREAMIPSESLFEKKIFNT